jgi:hypothetical protein
MPKTNLTEEQKMINRKISKRKYALKQAAIGNKKNLNITGSVYTRFEEFRSKETKQSQAKFLDKLLDIYEQHQSNFSDKKCLNSTPINEVRYT